MLRYTKWEDWPLTITNSVQCPALQQIYRTLIKTVQDESHITLEVIKITIKTALSRSEIQRSGILFWDLAPWIVYESLKF